MLTDKKKPAGDWHPTAGDTDPAMVLRGDEPTTPSDKEFRTLQAQYALRGHTLRRGRDDGAGGLYVARWGLIRELADLEDARRFLAQIGGQP